MYLILACFDLNRVLINQLLTWVGVTLHLAANAMRSSSLGYGAFKWDSNHSFRMDLMESLKIALGPGLRNRGIFLRGDGSSEESFLAFEEEEEGVLIFLGVLAAECEDISESESDSEYNDDESESRDSSELSTLSSP